MIPVVVGEPWKSCSRSSLGHFSGQEAPWQLPTSCFRLSQGHFSAQEVPRPPQGKPKIAQEALRSAKDCPNKFPRDLKSHQEAPKRPPRRTQEAAKRAQDPTDTPKRHTRRPNLYNKFRLTHWLAKPLISQCANHLILGLADCVERLSNLLIQSLGQKPILGHN